MLLGKKKMNISQNSINRPAVALIDYIPAELKINKDWMIVYFVLDPAKDKLVRKRKRVPLHKRVAERKKMASRIISTINQKLEKGWNPIIEDEAPKTLSRISETINIYNTFLERDYDTGEIRFDTKKTYSSVISLFNQFLVKRKIANQFVLYFNTTLISDYLDYIYIEKKLSTTTFNNHLKVLRLFSKFLIQKGYIKNDPTNLFRNKKVATKKRTVIERYDIKNIFEHLDEYYPAFSLLNKLIYYCYIRPTELTKLKVGDIYIKNQIIELRADVSKKSSGNVTIPMVIINEIIEHIKDANNGDYMFSSNKFKAGPKQSTRSLLYKNWVRNVVDAKFTNQPMYSLKDSGITFALDNGISTASVMNQARHTDLKITTAYIRKNLHNADVNIKNSNW